MGTKLYIDGNEFDALDLLATREGEFVTYEQLCAIKPVLKNLIEQVENAGLGFMWIEYKPESGYAFHTRWAGNL